MIHIPRTLELFVESLLTKTLNITNARNAKTLSPSHMKQIIMSENRFDFLRDLVKNVPDINVAEEQSYLEANSAASSSDGTLIVDSNIQPIATTNIQVDSGVLSRSLNGDSATTSSGISRNGNKRNFYASATCSSASSSPKHLQVDNSVSHTSSTLHKQHSLDISFYSSNNTTSSITNGSLATASLSHSVQPNYYTEISAPDPTVIQYTQTNKLETNLDIRPPKLTRIDSAPAILSNNTVSYSPNTRHVTSSSISSPLSSSSSSIGAPVINFDFSKSLIPTALSPPGPIAAAAAAVQRAATTKSYHQPATSLPPLLKTIKSPVPPLTPINTKANTFSTPSQQISMSPNLASHKSVGPLTKEVSTPPAFVKIDICNSPLVKIDYSNMDMSQISSSPPKSCLPSITNATTLQSSQLKRKHMQTTSTATSYTKKNVAKQMKPIINIDLTKNYGSSSKLSSASGNISISPSTLASSKIISNFPRVLTTTTASSSLEMDEDYDNI